MANYLSDPITCTFGLSEYIGKNVPYTVVEDRKNSLVYTGTVYVTGKRQTLYLNDIVYTLNDKYKWFINPTQGVITDSPHEIRLFITFDNDVEYTINNIRFATRVPNSKHLYYIPDASEDRMVSFNSWGTGVIPRLPKVTVSNPNLFMPIMVAYPQSTQQNNNAIQLALFNEKNTAVATITQLWDWGGEEQGISKYNCDSVFFSLLSNYFNNNPQQKNLHIGAYGDRQSANTHCKICYFDDDYAEYYVMWINRYGAWQSQPFCAKCEMKEKVTTNNIVTLTGDTVPCDKIAEFNWTLNSHWLTYEEYDEFESLLTSKYVYLYNAKTNEGYYVNVTDSNWTFKNSNNTKKPFNLTLNLTKSHKQNIIL